MARTNVVWSKAQAGQMNTDAVTVTMANALKIITAEITWDVAPMEDVFVIQIIPALMDKFVIQLERV